MRGKNHAYDTQAIAADASLRGAGRAPALATVAGTRATDKVDVSDAGASISTLSSGSDFDSAKVDAIRQAIRDGKFQVNPGAIADRLIADATALLGPKAS